MDSLEKQLNEIGRAIDSLRQHIGAESPLHPDNKRHTMAARAIALGEQLLAVERRINRLRAPFRAFTTLRKRISAYIKPRNLPTPKAPHTHIAPRDRFYTIVLAANEAYVPYMAVLVHSIITCATNAAPPPNHTYHSRFISSQTALARR